MFKIAYVSLEVLFARLVTAISTAREYSETRASAAHVDIRSINAASVGSRIPYACSSLYARFEVSFQSEASNHRTDFT